MEQEIRIDPLEAWWNETEFPSKELFHINGDGAIVLKAIGNAKERIISTLTPENAAITLKALRDKFPEVEAKLKELKAEWESAEDKMKLVGKVERMREYLQHTNAVGDFASLFSDLNALEKTIAEKTAENYNNRLALVQQAEKLADSDNWKETTQTLKEVLEQWKQIGYTEKNKTEELWSRLEAARTKFFDRKRAHQEEVNKDMLQNLDLKMELVEKAEGLANSENWKETTDVFKTLMEEWKKTGRVTHEKNEELWNRFIAAKNLFYDRKREHFSNIQSEQEANYNTKLALVEKAEALKDSTDWNNTVQAFADLMEEWKNIGRVPVEKADEIWNKFIGAKEHFFKNKKQHFETQRVSQEDNLAQKLALLKRAEDLQHSNQWREATEELNELMDEWKKIGPVPREQSKTIWDRFIGARRTFFDRKDANREHRKQRVEKELSSKLHHLQSFVSKIEAEIKDEEERLADFKNGIENITPGRKAEELREHLTKLIAQTEQKIAHKQEKLQEAKKQLQDFENRPKKKEATKAEKAESEDPTTEQPE